MEDLAQKFKSFTRTGRCDSRRRHQQPSKREAGEELDFTRLQQREKTLGHCWSGRQRWPHIRTVPVTEWVKKTIEQWAAAAGISAERPFW